MYLGEILSEVEKHMKENKVALEDAAINVLNGLPGGRLLNLVKQDTIKYLLLGKEGKTKYRYFEPVLEIEDGHNICTYVIYG